MGTRVSYPYEVKIKAIGMRLAGVPYQTDSIGIKYTP